MYRVDYSRLRFLIVDDNIHMRRIIKTILHSFGARDVAEAEDGASGLEMFAAHSPDIVFTDWFMPVFNGLELTRMIRQAPNSKNPYVPIVMISAYSEMHRVIEARDAGITEFLVKPISSKSLYQRVLSIVANPRPFIRTKTYFGPDRRPSTSPNYQGVERRAGPAADNEPAQAGDDSASLRAAI